MCLCWQLCFLSGAWGDTPVVSLVPPWRPLVVTRCPVFSKTSSSLLSKHPVLQLCLFPSAMQRPGIRFQMVWKFHWHDGMALLFYWCFQLQSQAAWCSFFSACVIQRVVVVRLIMISFPANLMFFSTTKRLEIRLNATWIFFFFKTTPQKRLAGSTVGQSIIYEAFISVSNHVGSTFDCIIDLESVLLVLQQTCTPKTRASSSSFQTDGGAWGGT